MSGDHDPSGQDGLEKGDEGEDFLHELPSDSFGRLLRFWRKVFEVSQESLALDLESSPRHISRLENGRVRPSRGMIVRIARHFGLGDYETKQLLYAGGFAIGLDERGFFNDEVKWLRKASARTLEAFDPHPAIIFDETGRIRMMNPSWLGLVKDLIPTSADVLMSHALDFMFGSVPADAQPKNWLEHKCATVMLLQQEAVLWDSKEMLEVVEDLVERLELPPDWQRVAARVDPISSIAVPMNIHGYRTLVTIFVMGVGLRLPTPYPARPRLTLMAYLVQKDPKVLERLQQQEGLDHPLLSAYFE